MTAESEVTVPESAGDLDAKAVCVMAAHLFDHENRLRALEGLPPVTAQQFRKALVDRCKAL